MALEFVDPEVAERVKLSSAPLVEGLVAAVVTASTGASLDAVIAEAERGLARQAGSSRRRNPCSSKRDAGGGRSGALKLR